MLAEVKQNFEPRDPGSTDGRRTSLITKVLYSPLLFAAASGMLQADPVKPSDLQSAQAWASAIERLEPKTPEGWRAAAVGDISAFERELRDSSPVFQAGAPTALQERVLDAINQAKRRAETVASEGGYFAVADSLNDQLDDPHLRLWFYRNWNVALATPETRWPGFSVRLTEGRLLVDRTDDPGVPVGSEVTGCDGRAPGDWVTSNVEPFTSTRAISSERQRLASFRRVLFDQQNPFARPPLQCEIRLASGNVFTRTLAWRALPSATDSERVTSPVLAAYALTFPEPDLAWITLPSFSGDATTTQSIDGLAETLIAERDRLREARFIVLDVRRNGGGSSLNADRIVDALWTAAERAQHEPAPEPLEIAWRASSANIDHWKATRAQAEERGDTALADFARTAELGLSSAIAVGEPLWIERIFALNPGPSPQPGASLFRAQVLLLSDGACMSACLDFADRVLHMPGARLVGADTGSDGVLMEIRSVPTPSGLTSMTIPQKIYLNRRRGEHEAYRAADRFPGPWTDEALRDWVRTLEDGS